MEVNRKIENGIRTIPKYREGATKVSRLGFAFPMVIHSLLRIDLLKED